MPLFVILKRCELQIGGVSAGLAGTASQMKKAALRPQRIFSEDVAQSLGYFYCDYFFGLPFVIDHLDQFYYCFK